MIVVDVVRMELSPARGATTRSSRSPGCWSRGVPLPALSPADHDYAAQLYRSARRSGATVRSMIDCLVAAVAVRLDAPVLAQDRDYQVLRTVSPLRLV